MENQQLSTNKQKGAPFKVGEFYGDLEILELYPNKDVCKVKCHKCGTITDMAKSTLTKRRQKYMEGCKICWQRKPVREDLFKYHKGDKIGDYELIECTGKQLGQWRAKCIKCGQEQIIRIANARKRIRSGCTSCNPRPGQRLPIKTNPFINYIKPTIYSLDERTYRDYKKKFEVFNTHKTRKYKEFTLTLDEWTKLIHSNCYYCGAEPSLNNSWNNGCNRRTTHPEEFAMNGIDRVDPNKGYTIDNCVPCCQLCNRMKWDTTYNVWITQMKKILNHIGESSTTISKESTLK